MKIRPSTALLLILIMFSIMFSGLFSLVVAKKKGQKDFIKGQSALVELLGLSDLALSTEARYTRHPAVTDHVVPFMDHPGAIDHFPSTLFWAPVR